MRLEDLGAQTRAHGNANVGPIELLARTSLGLHLLVSGKTGLVLGLACLRRGTDPLKLGVHTLGELGVAVALRLDARGLGLQVGGIVALVGIQVAAVDLADPLGNVIQEVAVVGNGKHGAGIVVEEMLEPQDGLGIQMIGRLVEQQQVGSLKQQLAQGHATTLTAGEHVHGHVGIRQLEGIHGLTELGIDIPAVGGVDLVLQGGHLGHERIHVALGIAHLLADLVKAIDLGDQIAKRHAHVLDNGLILVEWRLLLKDAHGIARGELGVAVRDLLDARHDLEQGRLAHAVGTHDADLRAREEAQGHVVENNLVAMRLTCLIHRVDKLGQFYTPLARVLCFLRQVLSHAAASAPTRVLRAYRKTTGNSSLEERVSVRK